MASQFFFKKSPDGPEVEIRGAIKVGRLETNDLVLRDARYASRHHATLTLEGEKLYVEDAGSSNGTFVNGHRVGVKTALQDKDTVRFDTEEYVVRGPPVKVDDGKTMFRGAESDKTQFRAPAAPKEAPAAAARAPAPPPPAAPPAAPPPAAAPPAAAPPPPAAPPSARPAADVPAATPAPQPKIVEAASRSADPSPGGKPRPGAWIDPQAQSDPNATKFITRDANRQAIQESGGPAPIDVDVPTLLIMSGTRAGQRIELPTAGDKIEWSIGSGDGLDVTLPDDGVSKVHAAIERSGDRWTVCNKLATNGVFVNGNPTARRLLSSTDRIEFGPVKTQFLLPKGSLLRQVSSAPIGAASKLASGKMRKSSLWIGIAAFVVTLAVIVVIKFVLPRF